MKAGTNKGEKGKSSSKLSEKHTVKSKPSTPDPVESKARCTLMKRHWDQAAT